LRREVSAEIVRLEKDIAELRQVLEQAHEPGSAAYLFQETKLLMRRLESAGMDARPLCDLVDVVDPAWVPAAEALLGLTGLMRSGRDSASLPERGRCGHGCYSGCQRWLQRLSHPHRHPGSTADCSMPTMAM
jgi:hypothetical protein